MSVVEQQDYGFEEFLTTYYKQDVADLLTTDKQALYVEWSDLYQWDAELAENALEQYDTFTEHIQDALSDVSLPVNGDLSEYPVRITDTDGALDRLSVSQALASEHIGDLVALRAQIGMVTENMSRMETVAFQCLRCPAINEIPQSFTRFTEPHECESCERQGPFQIDYSRTEFVDQVKVRFEQPPEEQASGSGDEIVGYCLDDLADMTLQDRAGSRVTVLGTVEVDDADLHSRGHSQPVVDKYFNPVSFIFDEDTDEIDVEDHREQVERLAAREDAIDVFRQSIDPGLTMVGKWPLATEMATAYLFGAPRIDPDRGDMVRGDIHMLFVSDPGMRKSVFAKNVADISPRAQLRDAGGMSSEVGLTSSASRDTFGDGKWSLSPGALPRSNGGHLILDEIDKGPDGFLGGIHGALEGAQQLTVDKADISATLATRVGFMALGNPVHGRFDPYEDIAEQIDLDPALMSRFDLVCTMQDIPDEEQDQAIAEGVLESIDESARLEYGDLDAESTDAVTPKVPRDVMKAWVKLARDEVMPMLTDAAKDVLDTFYVDTRQLNDNDSDTPPVTARKLVTGWRLSAAYARCELSDTIKPRHAERAVDVSKQVVGKCFDPEVGEFDANRLTEQPSTQKQRRQAVYDYIDKNGPVDESDVIDDMDLSEGDVRFAIKKFKNKGELYSPQNGRIDTI